MRAVFVFFFFWTSLHLPAQTPHFTARAELPTRNLNSGFRVFPLPDSAVLVINSESFFRYTSEKFNFYKLNHQLRTVWKLPVELPKGAVFAQAAFEKNTAYLLFQTFKAADWLLLRLDLQTQALTISRHRLPVGTTFTLSELKVLNGMLFLAGRQNNRLTILHLDPAEGAFTQLPAIYDQSSALTEFYLDTAARRAEFILTESNGQRARLQVKRLSEKGHLYSLNFIQGQRDINFLAGRLSPGDSLRKQVAGTYSNRDLRYAQGFFVSPLQPLPGESLKFHDFTRFSHYFDYLPLRRRNRLQRRISQLEETSRTYQFRTRILLHPLQPYPGGFVLVGELYMPRYQGTAGSPRVFDGFDYHQTLIGAFGKDGQLRWENSFPLKNVRFFELQEIASIGVAGTSVIACYPDEDKIRYKVITGAETSSNDLYIEVAKALPAGKLYGNYTEAVQAWYGPHFLIFGQQQVREAGSNRTVFRLDKLSFSNPGPAEAVPSANP